MYPALAVLQSLSSRTDKVLWVGGEGGVEVEMVKREHIPFETIPAAGVHGVGLRSLPGNVFQLIRGYFTSRRILKQFKPDVMLFTGGYVAVPMALAGIRVRSVLYVPDIEPGLALKTIARFADHITVTVRDTLQFLPAGKPASVTGYPTRANLNTWTKAKAADYFGMTGKAPVVLIFGGSKGARSINQAVHACLPELLNQVEVIHITGALDHAAADADRLALPADLAGKYHLMPYLDDMGAALAAADLAISRAGASILGEYPLFGLPSILVPYPYAWRYQKTNAGYLVNAGAALLLEDHDLQAKLLQMVTSLTSDNNRLAAMKTAAASLATPDAAGAIASVIMDLGNKAKAVV